MSAASSQRPKSRRSWESCAWDAVDVQCSLCLECRAGSPIAEDRAETEFVKFTALDMGCRSAPTSLTGKGIAESLFLHRASLGDIGATSAVSLAFARHEESRPGPDEQPVA